ncbi:MAG: class I SAM-dependent methyltransferase [Candidatus Lambdaproteobacteria bacterium]|nr:class I SAM-dependent methyltransferase [Candidatus Lambdaproteobacteria bacterium]
MRSALAQHVLRAVYDRKAPAYDLHHGLLTLHADERGRRLVVRHAVAEGDRVLDAGGGTGATALLAARKVGPKGRVVLLDFSEGMLFQARRKAHAAGLAERMDFRVGNMLDLPFEEASFDAVLSTYSLCPLGDPVEGVMGLYRVLCPGGLLGVAHSAEPANPLLRRLAGWVEAAAWRFPALSMGCRAVDTLPALEAADAELEFRATIGVPLWPFIVYVVRKPEQAA